MLQKARAHYRAAFFGGMLLFSFFAAVTLTQGVFAGEEAAIDTAGAPDPATGLGPPAPDTSEGVIPPTGLVPTETASPKAVPEAAAETGIAAVIARIRAGSRAAGDEGGRILTLKDAIRIAIMNNRSIQIQEEEVEYAKGNILYSKSLFLPQVQAQYGYTHNATVLYADALPNHRKDTRIYSGFINDNSAALNAQETIYNGGANIATLKQAKIDLKIQQETLRAAKLDIEFETKRLYYGLLLAYETRRIAQDTIDQAQAHYENVETKYTQGTASKFDVLQSKTQVSTLIPQLVKADNDVELIKVELKKLLVLDLREPVMLDGKLAYKPIAVKEGEFLKEAYQNRPEMIMKLLGVDLNKWGIEYAKAGWLPQVTASANYNYSSNNFAEMITPRNDNWSATITASIAIFDGFSTKAKVDEARAKYNQARLQKDDYVDQLAVDVTSACLDLKKAQSLIVAQMDSVEEAREAFRLSEVRYNNGVGINLDVFDSEVSLAQVEESLAQGMYDYIMAKAQLDKLRGREYNGGDA